MNIKSLFVKDKELRWSPYWVALLIFTIFSLIQVRGSLSIAFGLHFWRAGIWMIVFPLLAAVVWHFTIKAYNADKDLRGKNLAIFAGVGLFVAGIFGPLVAIKSNQSSGIPDEIVFYMNGKVKNPTDPNAPGYYFKYFRPSAEDSLYIITYTEEPGINLTAVTQEKPSTAPRANEDWRRPWSENAKKLKGKY